MLMISDAGSVQCCYFLNVIITDLLKTLILHLCFTQVIDLTTFFSYLRRTVTHTSQPTSGDEAF